MENKKTELNGLYCIVYYVQIRREKKNLFEGHCQPYKKNLFCLKDLPGFFVNRKRASGLARNGQKENFQIILHLSCRNHFFSIQHILHMCLWYTTV